MREGGEDRKAGGGVVVVVYWSTAATVSAPVGVVLAVRRGTGTCAGRENSSA